MNEFEIIDWIRKHCRPDAHTAVGPGDDCARINMAGADLAISTDAFTEGVHFLAEEQPDRIGWKAAAAALSDIAACGCEPLGIVTACLLPPGRGEAFINGLMEGMQAVCARFGISVSGGDLSHMPGGLTLVITAFGRVPEQGFLTRGGARAGDAVMVTGELGGSGHGRHLTFIPRIAEALRLQALTEVSAMIDISDGLYSELNHIARESQVGIEVDLAAVPVAAILAETYPQDSGAQLKHALADGEDYELLFTVPAIEAAGLMQSWDLDTPLARIGTCCAGIEGVVLKPDGGSIDPDDLKPYVHEF